MGLFMKAAVMGAATHAVLSSRSAQCSPVLNELQHSTVTDAAVLDLISSMALLDRNPQWTVEADDFKHDLRAATAQLRILRLGATYIDADGDEAPVMRLVGLFPGVTTEAVYRHLTDLQARPAWDSNYTFYERFDGSFDGTLQASSLQRPMALVAKKRPHCEGDVCSLIPDVSSRAFDHHWFCHGVGSAALQRVGLVDRLFQYERLSRAFTFAPDPAESAPPPPSPSASTLPPATSLTVYDILFSGSKRARAAAAAASPALGAWLQARRDSDACEGVDVNFQHIVLIPIADANEQLLKQPEQLHRLCTMGSVTSTEAAKAVYGVFKDTKVRCEQGKAPHPACLLVMTSANNVSVPKYLPSWMQRKISASVSRKAYGQLMAACVQEDQPH